MLYRLTPTLINEGKVFIAESPLYEITAKNDVYFAYDEAEKDKFIAEIGKEKFTIQRSKGLGENEPDMMNLTTMNPATRRLIKVMPTDAEKQRKFLIFCSVTIFRAEKITLWLTVTSTLTILM